MRRLLLLPILCSFAIGCGSHPHPPPATTLPVLLAPLAPNHDVQAYVDPPLGWRKDPLKSTARHQHQVWVSPDGNTAYGVIHFSLPLPMGHELALWAFLNEMKKSEGDAELVSKQWDQNSGTLRFVANGGRYCIRVNLFVDGFDGWAVYAGSLRKNPIEPDDLKLAEQARECTSVGLKDADRR
jgi:hypothetical protein